jgi:hypothetical protein
MKIFLLVLVFCSIGILFPAQAIQAPAISITPSAVTLTPGSSVTYDIRINDLPAGLSGYSMNVKLTNPAVAQITRVSYPDWSTVGKTSPIPANNVTISTVDLMKQVEDGAVDVTLATITVTSIKEGTTNFRFQNVTMDDDHGGSYNPDLPTAVIKVLPGNTTSNPIIASDTSIPSGNASANAIVTTQSIIPSIATILPTRPSVPVITVPATVIQISTPGLPTPTPVTRSLSQLSQRLPRWLLYSFGLIILVAALVLLYLGIKKKI